MWDQLVAIGRLMRPACTINRDDISMNDNDVSWLENTTMTNNLR